MRIAPLLAASLALLALAVPASAAESTVTVGDDFFKETTVKIQPGDSVKWNWTGSNSHTVTANPDQTEKFGSKEQSSGSFSRTFAKAGRFGYFCQVHPEMTAVVEIGAAPFPDTSVPRVAGATGKPGRGQAVVRFRLSEAARVKLTLRGPSPKNVTTKRLGKGSRKVRLRRLKPGRYRATLRATDAAGNKGRTATARFSVSR